MGGSPLPGFSFLSKDRVKEHFTTDWTHPPGPDWGQELGLPQAGGAGLDFPGGSPAGSGSPLRSSKCSGCCCRPTLTGVEEGAAAEAGSPGCAGCFWEEEKWLSHHGCFRPGVGKGPLAAWAPSETSVMLPSSITCDIGLSHSRVPGACLPGPECVQSHMECAERGTPGPHIWEVKAEYEQVACPQPAAKFMGSSIRRNSSWPGRGRGL